MKSWADRIETVLAGMEPNDKAYGFEVQTFANIHICARGGYKDETLSRKWLDACVRVSLHTGWVYDPDSDLFVCDTQNPVSGTQNPSS